jgi:hypothetical protein
VYFVAFTELTDGSDIESEAYALAPLLQLSVYDVRMRISGVLPRVLYQSPDKEAALRALAAIRARGNGAVACDSSAMWQATDLVRVHRFTVDGSALYANGASGPRFPWSDMAVVVVIAARTEVLRTITEKDLEGQGLQRAQRNDVEHTSHERVLERSAFLFARPHDDGTMQQPWILHERDAQFLSLGPRMQATRRANFGVTLDVLREHARGAIFDDRFVRHSLTSTELIAIVGTSAATISTAPQGVDIIVSLLAQWLIRGRGGP